MPSSASRGTSCFGGNLQYFWLVMTATIRACSEGDSAFPGRRCGPWRRSSAWGCSRQRSMVRADNPMRRDADSSRAPAVCASLTSVRIISRSRRPYRRPRPPRGGPLFFEDEKCSCLGECLFLPSELPLQLADALRRRHGGRVFAKRQPPLLELGEQQPLTLEHGRELRPRQLGGLAQHPHFFLDRPALRGWPLRRHIGQVTCLAEPSGQCFLRDARLSRNSPGALGTAPREALDHLLLVRKGEWFGHSGIAVLPHSGSSREATTTLALGAGPICHLCSRSIPSICVDSFPPTKCARPLGEL